MVEEQKQQIIEEISKDINYINEEMIKVDKEKSINTAPFLFVLLVFVSVGLYLFINKIVSHGIVLMGLLFVFGLLILSLLIAVKDKEKKFQPIKILVNEFLIKMIGMINSNLKYSQNDYIKQSVFYRSGIYTTSVQDYSGDNLIWGKLGHTNFMMSHIKAVKSKDEYQTTIVFNGLFMVYEFNKSFKGKTLVLPDIAQQNFGNIIGNWLQNNNLRQEDLVKLENVEFEKKFVAYSTNQIEARYILSPAIMEKILYINEKFNGIAVSFVDNRMFIAFPSSKAYSFSIPYDQLIDEKVVWSKYEYFKNMIDIAETIISELSLNNSICIDEEEPREEQQYNLNEKSNKQGETLKDSFIYITFFQVVFSVILFCITECIVSFFLKRMVETNNNLLFEFIGNTSITGFIRCLIAGLCIVPATNFAIYIFGLKHRITDNVAKKLSLNLLIIPIAGLLAGVFLNFDYITTLLPVVGALIFGLYYSTKNNLIKYVIVDYKLDEPEE